jgi:hypothetical protein
LLVGVINRYDYFERMGEKVLHNFYDRDEYQGGWRRTFGAKRSSTNIKRE